MAATNGSRIEILESAFVSSEEGNLFVQLAHAYRDSGDRLRAFRILRRGIEQHPTYGPAYELLGRVLLDQERIAEAEAVFERLLELEPRNAVAHGALDEIKRRMEPGPATAAVSLGAIPLGGPTTPPAAPRSPPSNTASGNWPQGAEPPSRRGNGDNPSAQTQPEASEPAPAPVPMPAPKEQVPTSEAQALEVSLKRTGIDQEQLPAETVDATTLALADMLVGLVEYRDPFFRGNTSLTRLLTLGMARELRISPGPTSAIALGAVLRDVGQFPLRNALNRPGLELPAGARKNMERHVDTALEMMSGVILPQITRDTVRHHHERLDGEGYPDGLKGDGFRWARALSR